MRLHKAKNMIQEVTQEVVEQFINGRNPQERIVAIECSYTDNQATIIYNDENGNKLCQKDDFKPFCWVKLEACLKLFNGNRKTLTREMRERGIGVKALVTTKNDGDVEQDRLASGFKFMFYAKRRMSFAIFSNFFKDAGVPIYDDKKDSKKSTKSILCLSPVEQYMIETGKRLFKGYDSYDELARFSFDLETTGLNPKTCSIEQIGIRCHVKGFEKVISVEKGANQEETNYNELKAIYEFCYHIGQLRPDVIFGHNSENFDFDFLITRSEMLGDNFKTVSENYIGVPIYKKKKEAILKLGGEVETYFPTILWGHNIVDSLHAARRAQAIDSSMESSNLKYVSEYLGIKKDNRVYVPGDKISTTWREQNPQGFAFNNTNGDWYKIDEEHPIQEGYEHQSGRYIVERYLLDDIYEADKVELALNEANFLVSKMLPTTFQKACTMGTAGIWKLIMLAWAYENDLAVPDFGKSKKFTGGLSRLLKTGLVENVVKLDYNSLYPSIILTWNIGTDLDITNSMLHMLNYVLTQREKYKGLKAEAGAKAKSLKKTITDDMSDEEKRKIKEEVQYWNAAKNANDKKQLPLKILGNSFFGSFGAPHIFPFGDNDCAEMTTCIGRQSLRLMIHHFTKLGYTPIVGDSFTPDTPVFIKYSDGFIDIAPIEKLMNDRYTEKDSLGREYDYHKRDYQVLCRSGWSDVSYVYRHETGKPIYKVSDGDMEIEVTEDHSLFDDNKKEIKPSQIKEDTKLEYYNDSSIYHGFNKIPMSGEHCARIFLKYDQEYIGYTILNLTLENKKRFIDTLGDYQPKNKQQKASIQYMKNCIKYGES